jgi:hypothetical protein
MALASNLTTPDTYARQAALDRVRLERAVEVLQGHVDRNFIERERIRLALRALLTHSLAEALPRLIELAHETNPDVPLVGHGL